jgi:hypothetical protein
MRAVVALALMLVCVGIVGAADAQVAGLNGSIWQVSTASFPTFFSFSTAGATFIATMLTFDSQGFATWFAVSGTLSGQAAFGSFILPSGFVLYSTTATATFTFTGTTGTFFTTGASFLPVQSGAFRRVF